MSGKIVQMMTADGWLAAIETAYGIVFSKLICWALIVYADGSTDIVGVVAMTTTELAIEVKGFKAYVHETERNRF